MEISLMKAEDIKEIARLEREAFSHRAWSEKMLFDELEDQNKFYFTARENGRVLGYAGFAQILDEAHIMNIAVDADARRRGIGRALVKALLDKAAELGVKAATLEVSERNAPAIALYKEMGFISMGYRPDYYGKGEGAFIFWVYL